MDSMNSHPAAEIAANIRSYLLHEYRARRAVAKAAAVVPGGGRGEGSQNSSEHLRSGDGSFDGSSDGEYAAGGDRDRGSDGGSDEGALSVDTFAEALFVDGDCRLPLLRPKVRRAK